MDTNTMQTLGLWAFALLGGGGMILNVAMTHTPEAVKYIGGLLLGNASIRAFALSHRTQFEGIYDAADKAADALLEAAAATDAAKVAADASAKAAQVAAALAPPAGQPTPADAAKTSA